MLRHFIQSTIETQFWLIGIQNHGPISALVLEPPIFFFKFFVVGSFLFEMLKVKKSRLDMVDMLFRYDKFRYQSGTKNLVQVVDLNFGHSLY